MTTLTAQMTEYAEYLKDEGPVGSAYEVAREMGPDFLASHIAKYGILTCPCCGGQGGWSGIDSYGREQEADCYVCDGRGYTTQARVDEVDKEEEAYQRELDAMNAEYKAWEAEQEAWIKAQREPVRFTEANQRFGDDDDPEWF